LGDFKRKKRVLNKVPRGDTPKGRETNFLRIGGLGHNTIGSEKEKYHERGACTREKNKEERDI